VSRAVAAHDDIAETWQPFAAAFADVVRDPAAVQFAEPVIDPVRAATMSLAAELRASRGHD